MSAQPAATSTLPTVTFPGVVHVGTLRLADRRSWSLEGDGLSVTSEPDAWERITPLSGRHWQIRARSGDPLTFLDTHALPDASRENIFAWAVATGRAQRVAVWTVTRWDDELDSNVVLTCATREEALDEAYDEELITQTTALTAVSAARGTSLGNVEDVALTWWVAETRPDLHGVWWDDDLDPLSYSAPRGVIVPTRYPDVVGVASDGTTRPVGT